jgi:CheY-like chemotaxis protein
MRRLICRYLQGTGWPVLGARDAQEALTLCRTGRTEIAALLTDYSLPGITGEALAREVRKLYPKASFAYMSGHRGLRLNPPGPILEKPLSFGMLTTVVEQLFGY